MSDSAQIRLRQSDLDDAINRTPVDYDPGSRAIVVKTTHTTIYPVSAQVGYVCKPVSVTGSEVEGGAVNLAVRTNTIVVFNIGGAIPPESTVLLAHYVDGIWVMRYC